MFSKYGYDNLLILLACSLVIIVLSNFVSKAFLSYPMLFVGSALLCLSLWFFRDPERRLAPEAEQSDAVVVAPADGKVVQISTISENEFIHDQAIQISIFLSPLDVHVNRYPASGVIAYAHYYPGEYLVAWHPKSSLLNERSVFGLDNPHGKIVFKQITGYLARRIVYDTKQGDTAKAGERFGMMKFGSRMDVIVPVGTEIAVKEGDVVRAAASVIARLKQ